MCRIRNFFGRAAAAVLIMAVILCLLPQTAAQAASLSKYNHSSSTFENAYSAVGADVTIIDETDFVISDATVTSGTIYYTSDKISGAVKSTTKTGWVYDSEMTTSNSAEIGVIYWNDWSDAVSTGTENEYTCTSDSGFSLRWSERASNGEGDLLDVEITVGQVTFVYYGKETAVSSDGTSPSYDCSVLFNNGGGGSKDGTIYTSTKKVNNSGSTAMVFGVIMPVTITFYEAGTDTPYEGTYCFYASDIDIADYIAAYKIRYTTYADITSISDYGYSTIVDFVLGMDSDNYDALYSNTLYQESWMTASETVDGKVYIYGDSTLKVVNASESRWGLGSSKIGRIYGTEETTGSDQFTKSAVQMGLETSGSELIYTGSQCGSQLFESYDITTYKMYLYKYTYNTYKQEYFAYAETDFSPGGALYGVYNEDGEIVGYFITAGYGQYASSVYTFSYVASTTKSSKYDKSKTINGQTVYPWRFSVTYDGVTYYPSTQQYMELSAGTYTVKELVAPDSYSIDETEYTVTLPQGSSENTDNIYYQSESSVQVYSVDNLAAYPVVLKKYTSADYTGLYNYFITTYNGYSLTGAQYAVYTDSSCTTLATDSTFTTSSTYTYGYTASAYGGTDMIYLPAGTYYLKEVTASDGYLITNSAGSGKYSAKITVAESTSVQTFSVYEDIDEADIAVLQKTDDSGNALKISGIKFKLVYTYKTSAGNSATRTLYYLTDSNGQIDFTDSSYLSSGTAFKNSSGDIIFGAGTITLTEVSGTDGYKLNEDSVEITISMNSDGTLSESYSGAAVSSGIFSFVNEEMTIDTVLTDDESGLHYAAGDDSISLTDEVTYDNFTEGETYVFKSWLYDVTEGAYAKDDDGNYIYDTAEVTVSSSSDTGTVELNYSFSGESLAGHTLVSWVFVYEEDASGNNDYLLSHKATDDSDQIVYLTSIETELLNADTEDTDNTSHVVMADSSVTLKDTVTYANLPSGYAYTFKAQLYDLTTGNYAEDDDGNSITATSVMYVSSSNSSSTKTLTYSFSGESLAGHTLVSYVTIYTTSKKVVWASEQDSSDTSQTVYFPSIDTVFTGTDGETKEFFLSGSLTLLDTVTLTGLKSGSGTWRLKVSVVSQEDGSSVALTNSGITAFSMSTSYSSSDSVTKKINPIINAAGLNGNYVAYEELYYYYNGTWVLVAEHKDINDEDQTVSIYSTADLIVKKTDSDGNSLGGAVFELYTSDDEFVCEVSINEDGSSDLIEDLDLGSYYLIETEAPDGYFIDEMKHEFELTEDDAGQTVYVTVSDTALTVLPQTGSGGAYTIAGCSLSFAAAALLMLIFADKLKRKRHMAA